MATDSPDLAHLDGVERTTPVTWVYVSAEFTADALAAAVAVAQEAVGTSTVVPEHETTSSGYLFRFENGDLA